MSETQQVAIVGAGPAGLIAADILSRAGKRVVVFEQAPSAGRKLLMAGRGGLNLTHSEPFETFVTRYGAAQARIRPMIEAFQPRDLIAWAETLGQQTFIGSSGRVFPKAMKASPLLRALLARLSQQGVQLRTRMRWTGWDEHGALSFANGEHVTASSVLLALGGASWPKLGSDGAWAAVLAARGVALSEFQPSNMGFDVNWSPHLKERFAGAPLKGVALRFGAHRASGEIVITQYGLEGGALYALSPMLREAIARDGAATISIDLRPGATVEELTAKLASARRGDSLANTLRKKIGLTPAAASLLRESCPPPAAPHMLAALIKAVPVTLTAPRGLERAISSAGGVRWEALDEDLQLKAIPNVYAAGEMLDWEAPTGGYLLQGCFSSGVWAARAILNTT